MCLILIYNTLPILFILQFCQNFRIGETCCEFECESYLSFVKFPLTINVICVGLDPANERDRYEVRFLQKFKLS